MASCVFKAAKENDETALAIIKRNTDRLATLINFTAKKYNCCGDVILAGGIARDKELFGDRILECLDPGLEIIYSDIPQVIGSARVCLEMFSKLRADDTFTDNIVNNYNNIIKETKDA